MVWNVKGLNLGKEKHIPITSSHHFPAASTFCLRLPPKHSGVSVQGLKSFPQTSNVSAKTTAVGRDTSEGLAYVLTPRATVSEALRHQRLWTKTDWKPDYTWPSSIYQSFSQDSEHPKQHFLILAPSALPNCWFKTMQKKQSSKSHLTFQYTKASNPTKCRGPKVSGVLAATCFLANFSWAWETRKYWISVETFGFLQKPVLASFLRVWWGVAA